VTTTETAASVVDLTIDCSTGGCSASPTGALFSEGNIYPGWNVTKRLDAKNNYPEDRSFAIEVKNSNFSDSTPSLAQLLTITIKKSGEATPLYGPTTIEAWKNAHYLILSNVPHGGNQIYELVVSMSDVGNEYQGRELKFDLDLGFETAPVIPQGYQPLAPHGTQSSPPGPHFQPGPTTTEQGGEVAGAQTGGYGGVEYIGELVEEVLGIASPAAAEATPSSLDNLINLPSVVAGTAAGPACQNPNWWLLLLLVFAAITLLNYWFLSKQTRIKFLAQLVVSIIFFFVAWQYFCYPWLKALALLIAIASLLKPLRGLYSKAKPLPKL